MAEFVKASAPPECLCGIRHWSTEREKCKFHERAPEPTPQPKQRLAQDAEKKKGIDETTEKSGSLPSAAKSGVETKAVKSPSRKQPSDKTSKKGETPICARKAVKKVGRPRKGKAA